MFILHQYSSSSISHHLTSFSKQKSFHCWWLRSDLSLSQLIWTNKKGLSDLLETGNVSHFSSWNHKNSLKTSVQNNCQEGSLTSANNTKNKRDLLLCFCKSSFLLPTPHDIYSSVQFSSVAQSCTTLCDPMNCSTSSLPWLIGFLMLCHLQNLFNSIVRSTGLVSWFERSIPQLSYFYICTFQGTVARGERILDILIKCLFEYLNQYSAKFKTKVEAAY